jgi:hypothetical protein
VLAADDDDFSAIDADGVPPRREQDEGEEGYEEERDEKR